MAAWRRSIAASASRFATLVVLLAGLLPHPPALAQSPSAPPSANAAITGSVAGIEQGGFGRMLFVFDNPVRATARISGGSVLVVTFSEPVSVQSERLAGQVPGYVSVVRTDPDGRAMRFALKQSLRVNVMEAGEKVFVDLIPSSWTGLLPGLPQDVVADLADRARNAEAKIREVIRGRGEKAAQPLTFRIGRLPTLTRLILEPPPGVGVTVSQTPERTTVRFDAPLEFDVTALKRSLSDPVTGVSAQPAKDGFSLTLDVEPGTDVRSFREDDVVVLDIARPRPPAQAAAPDPKPAQPSAVPAQPSAAAGQPARPDRQPVATVPAGLAGVPPQPVEPGPEHATDIAGSAPAMPSTIPPPPTSLVQIAAGLLEPRASALPGGIRIDFPFNVRTGAAAFQRGQRLTVVFDTGERILPLKFDKDLPPILTRSEATREKDAAIFQFTLARDVIVRLAPDGNTWSLSLSDDVPVPTTPLAVKRQTDAQGRTVVSVPGLDVSNIVWLADEVVGDRVAVATAFGPPRGVAKPHRLVEFTVLPSVQGVAVAAIADDVLVEKGGGQVSILRARGLSMSGAEAVKALSQPDLVIDRAIWEKLRDGRVRDRWREFGDAAAMASTPRKPEARLDLAAFLLANRLAMEAAGVLDVMAQDNQAFRADRRFVVLRSLADVMLHRDRDGLRRLAAADLPNDPEATLWKAVAEARADRWRQAFSAFQRAGDVLDAYPEDIQGLVRPLAIRAAVEVRDFSAAERSLNRFAMLPPEYASRQEVALLRARLDEGLGRTASAIEGYQLVEKDDDRPLAVEAMLRGTELALRAGALKPDEALAKFETLSIIWRGDQTEIRALSQMGHLYGETGQWRRAFQAARQANDLFPDHELTRRLHDETASRFEALFLDGKSESIGRIEAVALYFDFKEFTPVGRRGDELIRHLVDRLIDLDLLDQAGDLLQYQVENRLSGPAKATVATRLASLRLVSRQPQAALQILQSTRIPDLPAEVQRARLVLETRALADLKRVELAIEMLEGESGPEIDRLKADIYWAGQRWRDAGETIERMLGDRWRDEAPLTPVERRDTIRAGIAYLLAEETLALDRLRGKFARKMADSEDAATFAFLTNPGAGGTNQFRALAGAANADTLADFFADYRKRYPSVSTAARPRRPQGGADALDPPAAPPPGNALDANRAPARG